jgi:hypothetical protein
MDANSKPIIPGDPAPLSKQVEVIQAVAGAMRDRDPETEKAYLLAVAIRRLETARMLLAKVGE